MERVVVVGAGAAGVAACWAASRAGAAVSLFDGALGATALSGGAVDDRPWEEVSRSAEVLQISPRASALPRRVAELAEALDLWEMPAPGAPLSRLVTQAGRVRLARGHDRCLLDLSTLPRGARVLVPRVRRDEWDADSLVRCLADEPYCAARRLSFEAVDAKLLRLVGEDRIAAAELAMRHDDPLRRLWLRDRLAEVLAAAGRAEAILLGPWLGAGVPWAGALGEELGVVVGEVLVSLDSAAGFRFEAARGRLLERLGIERQEGLVTAVEARGHELSVSVEGLADRVPCDGVVLAMGGLVAGGIRYLPPEHAAGSDLPPRARVPFALSVRLDLPAGPAGQVGWLAAHGERLEVVSSMQGPMLDELAWPTDADPGLLEAVGLACDHVQVAPGVTAAGDVVADRPRTVLQAVHGGLRAGACAAGAPPPSLAPPA